MGTASGNVMQITPQAQEMTAYLLDHEDQLSEWERNVASSIAHSLKVRKEKPTHAQLMMMTMIHTRLKRRLSSPSVKTVGCIRRNTGEKYEAYPVT